MIKSIERKIYLIVDYRGKFYSSTSYWDASVRLDLLKDLFGAEGIDLVIISYSEITIDINKFKNQYVLYQSSEDKGLLYKNYIEDVILALKLAGAIVIPDYPMLRAHHNKCFMELLRKLPTNEELNSLQTYVFGTYEEFIKVYPILSDKKWVLKPASGALSRNVKLAITKKEIISQARKLSFSFDFIDFMKVKIKHLLRSRYIEYSKKSLNRNKFVIQEFIEGLTGDYKVLVYGKKYYILSRENRKNDFRASGSGLLNNHPDIPSGLFDFCNYIFAFFNVPYMSLDIAHINDKFHLIEFQFLMFGNYTLEKSDGYFKLNNGVWDRIAEEPFLEREIVTSIIDYIKTNPYKI